MQVRRKTPILEARQFTEESAVGLIKDGWLSDVGVINGEAWGRVTRSVTRSREVLLGGWIVLEQMRNETVDGHPKPATVAYFRPLSAEQFTEDFEVLPGDPGVMQLGKRTTVESSRGPLMGRPVTQELLDSLQAIEDSDEALRASLKNMPCELVVDRMPNEAELEEALIEAADAPKAKK